MQIGGMITTSFIDYPNNISTAIFTNGCNMNCKYCHNHNLIQDNKQLFEEEKVKEVIKNKSSYIDGVVISGGEPTLQNDLIEFCQWIKELGLKIKLDTNGTNPNILKKLFKQGMIDYIAVDIKGNVDTMKKIDLKYEKNNKLVQEEYAPNLIKTAKLIKEFDIKGEFRSTLVPTYHDKYDIESAARIVPEGYPLYLQNYRHQGVRNKFNLPKKGFAPQKMKKFKEVGEQYLNKVIIRDS